MGWRDAPVVEQGQAAGGQQGGWQSAPVAKPQSSPANEFGRHFSGAVADVFGAPASLFNMGWQGVENVVAPLMGNEPADVGIPLEGSDIRRAIHEHGDILPGVEQGTMPLAGEEPTTLAGRAGQYGGYGFGTMVPLAGVTSRIAPAAPGATGVGNTLRNIGSSIGQQFVRNPKSSAAIETGFGALSGGSGYVAEQSFPDNPNARMFGELAPIAPIAAVSGLTNLVPKSPLVRAGAEGAQRIGRQLMEAYTPKGASERATARIQRATDDPRQAAGQLREATPQEPMEPLPYGREGAEPPLLAPETQETLPGLTPAQKTGDPGLMELERSAAEKAGTLRQRDEQLADVNRSIREGLEEAGGQEATDATRRTFEQAQSQFAKRMADRVARAEQQAQKKLESLGPNVSQEQANRAAREEVEKALRAARQQEKQLYAKIPENTAAPYSQTEQTYQQILRDTGKAQQNDIPSAAKRAFNKKSSEYIAQGQQTTIKDLRSLQSKLREQARLARSNSQWNRARIADDLADSITDDLANAAAGPQAAQDIKDAVSYSRTLNEQFSQGTVGKLLGRTKAGGEAVPESLTLESTLGVRGPKAREAYDDIVTAANTPALQGAVEDYVKNRFLRDAVRDGQVDATKAENFIRGHADLLDRNPGLKQQLQEAIDAGDVAALYQRQADSVGKRLGNPRVSKAELFIQKDSRQAFDDLRQSRNPGQETQKLLNMARRDTTGEAEQGLKAGFMDYLLSKSRAGGTDIKDQQFVSGLRLRELLDDKSINGIMNRLLTTEERKRLNTIANTAERLDMARKARPSQEGVIGDEPSVLVSILGRISGAQVGRVLAGMTGGGTVQTPGIISGQVKQMIENGVKDPASKLLIDAMGDEELFRVLLMNPSRASARQKEVATQRLHAWLANSLRDIGVEPTQQETTEEGRSLVPNEDGSFSSERTETFQTEKGWVNVPTMFNGEQIDGEQALQRLRENDWIDPETGRKLEFFNSVEKAEQEARKRSNSLGQQIQQGQ